MSDPEPPHAAVRLDAALARLERAAALDAVRATEREARGQALEAAAADTLARLDKVLADG